MPSESIPAPQHKSLESLKVIFKGRLDAILYKQLTVENIETFADEALSETVALTGDILKEYKNNLNFHAEPATLNTQQEEDEAFAVFDLPNINEILQSIIDIKEKIDSLKIYIDKNTENIDEVITPPQINHNSKIEKGDGSFERKKIFPRLLTLLYILEHDFEIIPTPENVPIKEGVVTPEMLRKTPYARAEIPELERVVYICEEEGNVSYVFDAKKLAEKGLTLEEIDIENKGDKNSLIAKYPGIGIRLIQSKNWRDHIATALGEEIPETQKETKIEQHGKDTISQIDIPTVAKGELDSWRGFWTDPETGMHWGSKYAIARKLGKFDSIFRNRTDDRLQTLILLNLSNQSQDGYCFEQLIELFPELQTNKQVETEGQWRGFWTNPETGKHWASEWILANKFCVNSTTIKRYIEENNLKHIYAGYNTESYCYEDFLTIDKFLDLITAPQANEKGEWSGFWVDDNNQHWAPLRVLGSYFNIEGTTISLYIKKMNLVGKNIKTRAKQIQKAFPLESFKENKEFMKFMNSPKVAIEGAWKGFWIDDNGKHWGPIDPILKKLSISRNKFRQLIQESPAEFFPMSIKDISGRVSDGFCLEEIEKLISK